MARAPLLALAALLVAGCAAPLDGIDPGSTPRAVGDLLVSEAVTLTTPEGPGFEPGIAVAPDGALYAAAAKTQRPHSGGRLADWLWHSQDGGATWNDVPAPDAFRLMPGLEGDVAVDGEGRLYYLDIWGPDLSVSRWSPGPTWDWSRPVAGTPAPLDDRPFAAAHGDGRVYLLSNQAVEGQRIVVSRSLDGGVTWTQAFAFPGSLFCRIDASPADDKTVAVACSHGEAAGTPLLVYTSADAGATWTPSEVPDAYSRGTGYMGPGVAFDAAGALAIAWTDERVEWSGVQDATWAGSEPGRVAMAVPAGETWRAVDVTPFEGRFGMIQACAGPEGVVGASFYATRDLDVGDDAEWFAVGVVARGLGTDAPAWAHALLSPDPVSKGGFPPRDTQDCAFDPDGAMHVVFQRNRYGEEYEPGDGIRADVLHVSVAAP